MKKTLLLLTILCVGVLNSMENPNELKPEVWQNLPNDVKPLIIMALTQSGDDIDSDRT